MTQLTDLINVVETLERDCGELFKRTRKELKLTQSELSAKINMPPHYIEIVEAGQIMPSSEVLRRLYKVYKDAHT